METPFSRAHRRTFNQFFNPRVVRDYYPLQRIRSLSLVKKLTSSPEDFFNHVHQKCIQSYTGSLVLEIAYGYTLSSNYDPYVKLAYDANEGLTAAGVPGAFLVDFVPILRFIPGWFPGATFKHKAKHWAKCSDELVNRPWEWLKEQMEYGTAAPSFFTRHLERAQTSVVAASSSGSAEGENSTQAEEVIKNTAAVAYQTGAETTTSALLSFILAMALHPEFQTAAQAEIDALFGPEGENGKLPDFDDKDKKRLPYIEAVLKEVLRWNPVGPLSVAHRSVEDDVYDGYFIPGGTTVIPNSWAVLHSEDLYGPNPMSFDPGRFTRGEVKLDPENVAFGYGRRACLGRHFALNTLWISMVYILSTFDIKKPLDSDGKEVEPEIRYGTGLVWFVYSLDNLALVQS
ncbi:hypothetical protein V5O48_009905 [Marasmius crinis-equi]|uniref:Cytochrome P450 n=1 Tax=Marasmius crinis-equi TaxID=585013 RepID=A0ABR3FA99_9AGAR